jgi:hypothetical protein
VDEIVHVTSVYLVSTSRVNVFEDIIVLASLLVPSTDIYPVEFNVLTSGVNVDVYVAPLSYVVLVPKVPPLIRIIESSNFVVAGLIENVIVAVSPAANVVLSEDMVHVTSETFVFIERLSDDVVNVVVASLLVPDTVIDPVVVVNAFGVKVAVYVNPLSVLSTVVKVPSEGVIVIKELLNLVVGGLIVNVIVEVWPA